jgi:hypothetical protein
VNGAPRQWSSAPRAPVTATGSRGEAAAISVDPAHLRHARSVADAILYEGYLLYPYRGDAQKNQARFQFGVLMPPAYRKADADELSATQTECLLECPDDTQVQVVARFLHLQRRSVETISAGTGDDGGVDPLDASAGTGSGPWDEAIEREERASASVAWLLAARRRETAFHISGGQSTEARTDSAGNVTGWTLRHWSALRGTIALEARRVAGPYQALRLRVRVENHSQVSGRMRSRQDGLRQALISTHVLIAVPGATFLSMVDPPEWAAAEVAACVNTGTWPVLAGPADCRDLVLSSPVILYDHPEIAAESAGDLYDATEIDEILTLRTMALTEAEKRQARETDPRAAALIDRVGDMPPEMLERMHGAIRYLRAAPAAQAGAKGPSVSGPGATGPDTAGPQAAGMGIPGIGAAGPDAAGMGIPGIGAAGPDTAGQQVPWWDPGADTSVSPETDHIIVGGVRIARGSRVRMRPGSRRADAQDLFLVGREAVVEAVLHDVDGHPHLAVTPADDPAADLNRQHGRFLYFAPDEVEPIGTAPSTIGDQPEEETP